MRSFETLRWTRDGGRPCGRPRSPELTASRLAPLAALDLIAERGILRLQLTILARSVIQAAFHAVLFHVGPLLAQAFAKGHDSHLPCVLGRDAPAVCSFLPPTSGEQTSGGAGMHRARRSRPVGDYVRVPNRASSFERTTSCERRRNACRVVGSRSDPAGCGHRLDLPGGG